MRLIRAEISSGFFLLMAALFYFDTENLMLYSLIAAALHEAAHLAAIRMKGGHVEKLRLTALGAEIKLGGTYGMSYFSEIFIYLSGPAVNFIVAVLFSFLGELFLSEELFAFSGLNLSLGIFNLLPVKMLDGGNILRCLSMHFYGRVIPLIPIIQAITVTLLTVAGIIFMRDYGFNLSLYLVSAYLVIGGLIDRRPVFRGLSNDVK